MTGNDERYPARTEITVLSADPERERIGLPIFERDGFPICLDYKQNVPLLHFDDLKLGTQIFVPDVFISGQWLAATVTEINRETYQGIACTSQGTAFFLTFNQDERACWTVWGQRQQ